MTPQHSTLRISALYHARGMISQSEYRDFRARYLEAVIHDQEPPELPDAWHHAVPGTYTVTEEHETLEMKVAPDNQDLAPRTVAIVLTVVMIVIGGLIGFMAYGPG